MSNRTRVVAGVFAIVMIGQSLWGQGPGHGGGESGLPGSFPGHRGLELEHNLVLPQIAVGRDISTTLTLSSLGDALHQDWLEAEALRTSGTVYFFRQDGSPLPVHVNGSPLISEYPFEVNASALIVLRISLEGPNTAGWALIVVNQGESSPDWGLQDGHEMYRGERIMATAFYSVTNPGGQLVTQVGVVPAVFDRTRFHNAVLFAQFGDAINTGVAFVNPVSETVEVEVSLRDAAGQTVATQVVSLLPGEQRALFIDQLFPGVVTGSFQGTLELSTADEGLVSIGLLMTQGILTSIPTHHFGQWERHGGMMP